MELTVREIRIRSKRGMWEVDEKKKNDKYGQNAKGTF